MLERMVTRRSVLLAPAAPLAGASPAGMTLCMHQTTSAAAGYRRSVGALTAAPRLGVAGAAVCAAVGVAALALLPLLHTGQPAFEDRALIVRLAAAPRTSPAAGWSATARKSTASGLRSTTR